MTNIYAERVVGIDPGLKGGIAAINSKTDLIVKPMPVIKQSNKTILDIKKLRNYLSFVEKRETLVVIEKVHSMPKQGVASSFKFGEQFGAIQGVCAGLRLPYILVTPQQWKKEVLKGYDWKGNKNISVQYIKQRFPDISLLPTEKCTTDSDGMAEALCLAIYGFRYDGDWGEL